MLRTGILKPHINSLLSRARHTNTLVLGRSRIPAPEVHAFGEEAAIDRPIRRYVYCGTPSELDAAKNDPELAANLSAAAHLIRGSSVGRFTFRYCPGHLTREEIEGVGCRYGDLAGMMKKYDLSLLRDGYNSADGEEILLISNPGLGLQAYEGRFE